MRRLASLTLAAIVLFCSPAGVCLVAAVRTDGEPSGAACRSRAACAGKAPRVSAARSCCGKAELPFVHSPTPRIPLEAPPVAEPPLAIAAAADPIARPPFAVVRRVAPLVLRI